MLTSSPLEFITPHHMEKKGDEEGNFHLGEEQSYSVLRVQVCKPHVWLTPATLAFKVILSNIVVLTTVWTV